MTGGNMKKWMVLLLLIGCAVEKPVNGDGVVVSWTGSTGCTVRMENGDLKTFWDERVPVGRDVKIRGGKIYSSE